MSRPYVNDNPVKTYRQLWEALIAMNDEQLDSNITVILPWEEEFYPANLKITNRNEHNVLDDNNPVIYIS